MSDARPAAGRWDSRHRSPRLAAVPAFPRFRKKRMCSSDRSTRPQGGLIPARPPVERRPAPGAGPRAHHHHHDPEVTHTMPTTHDLRPEAHATPIPEETCPYCGATAGVRSTDTPRDVLAWSCGECGLSWAISVANPHLRVYLDLLAQKADENAWLRRALRAVITLAEDAPTITDARLRDRLLALRDGIPERAPAERPPIAAT
ncbi:MAG: hypothetical protein ACRDRS_13905 [Pseudonocardiaceae bacterium]